MDKRDEMGQPGAIFRYGIHLMENIWGIQEFRIFYFFENLLSWSHGRDRLALSSSRDD